jgi:hypothetical protein
MAGVVGRVTVILHCYPAIAVGLLMVMWFVSGIVMTCPSRASRQRSTWIFSRWWFRLRFSTAKIG